MWWFCPASLKWWERKRGVPGLAMKAGDVCSMRLASLVFDVALDGAGHGPEQSPVVGGECRL